jgi:predicted DNA-binding transcriptional regulator AlpA
MTVDTETERPSRQRKPASSESIKTNLRAPPASARLLSKHEVLGITGRSYPTIWLWMREGRFPRSRIVGGRSMWLSTEVDGWVAELPVRPLKGDAA